MCKLVNDGRGNRVADIKLGHIENIARQAEACKNISRIVLFGSSIEERCSDKSDIDIAVFGDMTKNRYLMSKEFKKFHDQVFLYDMDQDYDILYFRDGQEYSDAIMNDIHNGAEIYRRVGA